MMEFLFYDLKVAVLIAAFYFCYRLLMERDTLHRLNRVVLLVTLVLSLVLPLCVVTFHETQWIEPLPVDDQAEPDVAELGQALPVVPARQWWQLALTIVVVGGMVLRLAYLLRSYAMLRRMLRSGEEHLLDDGVRLVVVDQPVAPFSWMNTIVVNRQDYAERNALLLIHERSHIRLHHSRDVVFVELLTVLQWFNPVVWLLSRDLRTVHEYEADEAVLSQGADTAQYITLLMHKATGVQACALVNGINTSETKKRIKMMIKMKSPRWSWLKCLYIVPIAALSLAVTAQTVTDYRTLPTDEKTGFALHAILDDYGRITGFTHEGEPDSRRPETFHVGYVFIDDREATPEEVANYKSLMSNAETFEMIHRPNETGDPKYSYRDKQGILIFHMKKQVPQLEADPVFDICEVMPHFPGGEGALMQFVAKNVKYPVAAEEYGVQGRVMVRFIVEKDGSISNVNAIKVTDPGNGQEIVVVAIKPDMTEEQRQNVEGQNRGLQALKDESARVVKMMPKWIPGKQNGQAVRVHYFIPVSYRLN
ncbi:MAG: energy transducer TonB [Prevotella sp.]|nr:energy transducer TonB [Prevotella sp.]